MHQQELDQLSLAQAVFTRRSNGESIEDIAGSLDCTVEQAQFYYDLVVVAVLNEQLAHEKRM